MYIINSKENQKQDSLVFIHEKGKNFDSNLLSDKQNKFVNQSIEKEIDFIQINNEGNFRFIAVVNDESYKDKEIENFRLAGAKANSAINAMKLHKVGILSNSDDEKTLAFAEGLALTNYQFLKYFQDKDKKQFSLSEVLVYVNDDDSVEKLNILIDSVFKARDLVNEPLIHMTAVQLSEEFKNMTKDSGLKVEVFDKSKIESLKMGGLLAVNKGSIDPPTFSILKWEPENPVNEKPIILVGKGVVYDTGGLSLKPTADSMDKMKSDMGGAAAVASTIYAVAKAKLPVKVIALVPATDNRPGGNAYTPGDVIEMHNGMHVEVLNTDAEGRMILADALSYAKSYDPELVIDVATLTGAAAMAIGHYGIVGMGNADKEKFNALVEASSEVYERVVEFPFWDEYKELLKSDVADIKNIGGRLAGSITAGKFLEYFTDYPYIHLDIAGSAFSDSPKGYRPKGGTGAAVRPLFKYLSNYAKKG